ncbi:MAG: energy transducer TonB [Acidobacteriaceae bacterium]|nr:energy transducer TonB [Acidobacteriaceae bacterium]
MLASEELTDAELNEMLGAWIVPDPPLGLKRRVFSHAQTAAVDARVFCFEIPSVEQPWYKSLILNVRDLIRPPKLPPLQITAKPVEVGTIWAPYRGGRTRFGAISLLIHAAAVALVLGTFGPQGVQKRIRDLGRIVYVPNYKPKLPTAAHREQGGGGGGMHQPRPAVRGAAPPQAPKQFTAPAFAIEHPKLPDVPKITAPAPMIVAENYGDLMSKLIQQSGGPGSQGFGSGSGGGVGSGTGDGFGPGTGGGTGGGAYQIGGDVSAPQILTKIEPEYSEEARKAKYSGTVLLSIVVDEHGLPRNITVIRPLGLGLDRKAIEAVSKWRFRPGMKAGRPVPTVAQVEVNFRLL